MSREVIEQVVDDLYAAFNRDRPGAIQMGAIVNAIQYLQSDVTLTDEGDIVQPAPLASYALLDEMRAFINLIKGSALQGGKFFNPERCQQLFEECARLDGKYLTIPQPVQPAIKYRMTDEDIDEIVGLFSRDEQAACQSDLANPVHPADKQEPQK